MQKVNEFYPISEIMQHNGMWEMGVVLKLQEHMKKAKSGDRVAESKLCNRVGQLRRNVSDFGSLTQPLQEEVRNAVIWLRAAGRTFDLSNDDPRKWITARDGKTPRF